MSPRKFDRIMVDLEAGGNGKLGRLTDAEFRCHITGVLPLAAKAPVRGRLLVGDHKATIDDIARQARMSPAVARKTLSKLRDLGIVEPDEEFDCEMVHDFEDWNPAPKFDRTAAERQRRYRERMSRRNGGVTSRRDDRNGDASRNGSVTAQKGIEEKTPLTPQGENAGEEGTVVTFDRRPVPPSRLALAEQILTEFNRQAQTSYGAYTGRGRPSEDLRRIIGALTDATPPLTFDEAQRMIAVRLAKPYWEGRPHTGVVFGPKAFSGNRESAKGGGVVRSTETAALAAEHARRFGTGQEGAA